MKILLPGLVALVLSLGGCAVNPVTGKQDFALMSEKEEIDQGRRFHREIVAEYGVYDDPELQAYVDRIGQQLAAKSHRAHLRFTFTVLDSPEINAFALPGGYIYVTRGIMAYLDSEAELAGVLGHEIGHVTARHSVRQQAGQMATDILSVLISAATGEGSLGNLSQTLGAGLVRGYGRDHELEADRLGAQYLHNIGHDPETMLQVIGVLKDQEIYERELAKKQGREPNVYHGVFSTHPRNDDRLKTVVRAARKLAPQEYLDARREPYHARIDGLSWGSSIHQGVVTNNRFSHPDLAITLDLPPGWQVDNGRRILLARDSQSGARLQIEVQQRRDKEPLDAFLRRLTDNVDLEVAQAAYGVTAITGIRLASGARQPGRLSAIGLDEHRLLILLGTASDEQFVKIDPLLLQVNRSFGRLTPEQAAAITGPVLRIVARTNQDFASLAKTSAIEYDAESILRLLNRSFPGGDIKSLDRIKVVVTNRGSR